ncbi:MAG: cache domain-containing protein [Desulfobulbus sp.]|jgi:signal transduction histidine kinase|nr:cache domain-containing protein [Desulfobulbus sp.]
MKRVFFSLVLIALFLLVVGCRAAEEKPVDEAAIKRQVDEVVEAINNGTPATSFAADAYEPYVFIMAANGTLLIHPYLQGEDLPEKAAPIYQALLPATSEGGWVSYLWKGAKKHTYVRRTNSNLTVGSGS